LTSSIRNLINAIHVHKAILYSYNSFPFDIQCPTPFPFACFQSWNESGIIHTMFPEGIDCEFDFVGSELNITRGILNLQLSNVSNINFITIKLTSFDGATARFYAGSNNLVETRFITMPGTPEEITFNNIDDYELTVLEIACLVTVIDEIIIDYDPEISNCETNLQVDNVPIEDGHYESSVTLHSKGLVPAGGDVSFGSAEITLNENFEVISGATFLASIAPCSG